MSEKQTNQNTFVSHLSELRSRLVKSFIFLIISFIICYFFSEEIYRFLVKPYSDAVLENKEGMSLNDYCENIRKAVVELSIPFQDVEINITISGGVINSSEVKDQEELVNLADERLYKAKEGGRNQFIYS